MNRLPFIFIIVVVALFSYKAHSNHKKAIPLATITADINGVPTSFDNHQQAFLHSDQSGFVFWGSPDKVDSDFIMIVLSSNTQKIVAGTYSDSLNDVLHYLATISYVHDNKTYSTGLVSPSAIIKVTKMDSTTMEGSFEGHLNKQDNLSLPQVIITNGKFKIRNPEQD
jgi:hypothetical protein